MKLNCLSVDNCDYICKDFVDTNGATTEAASQSEGQADTETNNAI